MNRKTLVFGISLFLSITVAAQSNTIDAKTDATKQCVNNACKEENIWNVIQNRRSVREFKSDSIPEKDIIRIIDAARMAPTSGNQQPWKFLVIKDKNKINQMKQIELMSIHQTSAKDLHYISNALDVCNVTLASIITGINIALLVLYG